jgi:hypothetical protein
VSISILFVIVSNPYGAKLRFFPLRQTGKKTGRADVLKMVFNRGDIEKAWALRWAVSAFLRGREREKRIRAAFVFSSASPPRPFFN